MCRLFLFFLFYLFVSTVYGQNFCKKASVYFDLNQSELKPDMLRQIDRLFAETNGQTVVAELYGYSDSLATAAYNLRLSEKRTAAVKAYIQQKHTSAIRFTEKNLGEEKAGSADPSRDRRVDLFLVPVSGDELVLDNGKETVRLPIDYFEPCGVCHSRPTIAGIYTDAEAEAAGMRFETNDGVPLITAGTVDFNFEPCDPKKKSIQTYCITVSAASLDRDMQFWEPDTTNGIIYWKLSSLQPEFDTINGVYRVCGIRGRGPRNLDKPAPASGIVFPFKQVRSTFYLPGMQRLFVTPLDSIGYRNEDTIRTVVSVGTSGERLFFLKELLQVLTERIDTTRPLNRRQVFRVPRDYYTEFVYSDTLLKVRFGRKTKATQFGFYLPEFNEFVPVKPTKNKRYYVTQLPLTPCIPAIIKGKTLYVLDTNERVFRYNKHQHACTARISKKKMRVFRREKAWLP